MQPCDMDGRRVVDATPPCAYEGMCRQRSAHACSKGSCLMLMAHLPSVVWIVVDDVSAAVRDDAKAGAAAAINCSSCVGHSLETSWLPDFELLSLWDWGPRSTAGKGWGVRRWNVLRLAAQLRSLHVVC